MGFASSSVHGICWQLAGRQFLDIVDGERERELISLPTANGMSRNNNMTIFNIIHAR
jgi:hypothetical protein